MVEIIITSIVILFALYVVIDLRKNSLNLNSLKQCTKCGTLQKAKCIRTRKSKVPLKERKNHPKFQITRTYKCSNCSSTFEVSSLVLLGSGLDSFHDDSTNHSHDSQYHDYDSHHHDSGSSHDGGFDGGHD